MEQEDYQAMWRYTLGMQYLQSALNLTAQRMDSKQELQIDSPNYANPAVQLTIAATYFSARPGISDQYTDYSAEIQSTVRLKRRFDRFLQGDHSGLPERLEETRRALKALSALLESMGDPAGQAESLRTLAERT